MWKLAVSAALSGAIVPQDKIPESAAIVCTEERGGWCESSGECYKNTLPPATYAIQMIRIPLDGESTNAIMKECRGGKCGKDWEAKVSRNAINYDISSEPARFIISEETNFFTHFSYIHALDLSRVLHSFGYCEIRKNKFER